MPNGVSSTLKLVFNDFYVSKSKNLRNKNANKTKNKKTKKTNNKNLILKFLWFFPPLCSAGLATIRGRTKLATTTVCTMYTP